MEIKQNLPLKNFTTMRLGGDARFLAEARNPESVRALVLSAKKHNIPFYVLGGGSNVIAKDEGYTGLVILNRIKGIERIAESADSVTFKIGAGEIWDDFVKMTVEEGLVGVEAMSAIPGTCGAAPVQNVGAYGQETADTLVSLEAYDSLNDAFVELSNADCGFEYRHSIFRGSESGRYVITSITMKLYRRMPEPPFYKALQDYFDERMITMFTPQIVRDAVIDIRSKKLPDPTKKPNTGSFFKNAIVEDWQLADIKKNFPDVPTYDMGDGRYKIPTGWMIEQTGLKGALLHGMRINEANCLVLINESAASYSDLAKARDEIQTSVRTMFNVGIHQEPLEIQ